MAFGSIPSKTDRNDWIEVQQGTNANQVIVHSFNTTIASNGDIIRGARLTNLAFNGVTQIVFYGYGGDDTFKNSFTGTTSNATNNNRTSIGTKVSETCVAEGAAGFRFYVAIGWRVGWLGCHARKKGDAGTENDLDRITKNARLRKSLENIRT